MLIDKLRQKKLLALFVNLTSRSESSLGCYMQFIQPMISNLVSLTTSR